MRIRAPLEIGVVATSKRRRNVTRAVLAAALVACGCHERALQLELKVGPDGTPHIEFRATTPRPTVAMQIPGGAEIALPVQRRGDVCIAALGNLPTFGRGVLVVQVEQGGRQGLAMRELSWAGRPDDVRGEIFSADGLFSIDVAPTLPARTFIMSESTSDADPDLRTLAGPYTVVTSSAVTVSAALRVRLNSPPTLMNGNLQVWGAAGADRPFSPIPAVSHPLIGVMTFTTQLPARVVLRERAGVRP